MRRLRARRQPRDLASGSGGRCGTYRALAIDLDGTLLNSEEEISERNLKALRAARAAGFSIILATARWYQLAARVAAEAGAVGPIVACSGAQVRLPQGHDLLDLRLPAEFAAELYALCDSTRCIATVAFDERVLVKMEGSPSSAEMPPGMTAVASLAREADSLPRIALIQGSETNRRIAEELAPRWKEHVRFVESISSRGKSIYTLTVAGADKGVALAVACADLGLGLDEVVAFGDAENDIEMFRVAGGSYAMGQASAHVQSLAKAVTASNEHDGVAVAIEDLLATGEIRNCG